MMAQGSFSLYYWLRRGGAVNPDGGLFKWQEKDCGNK
jgi:hypothetical protein